MQSCNWFINSYAWNYWEYVVLAILLATFMTVIRNHAFNLLLLVQMLLNRGFAGPRPAKTKRKAAWSSQELRSSLLNAKELTAWAFNLTTSKKVSKKRLDGKCMAWGSKNKTKTHTHTHTTWDKMRVLMKLLWSFVYCRDTLNSLLKPWEAQYWTT